jgi:hypothetical protein
MVGLMAMERKEVAAMLMRAGLPDLAAQVDGELPDPVETDELQRFAMRHGLSRDWMINRMGGSP